MGKLRNAEGREHRGEGVEPRLRGEGAEVRKGMAGGGSAEILLYYSCMSTPAQATPFSEYFTFTAGKFADK